MTVMFDLESRFDPRKVVEAIPDSIYNPHKFSGVKVYNLQPFYSALVFNSGKVTITGVTSMEHAEKAARHLYESLRTHINVRYGSLEICNFVGSMKIDSPIHLINFYNSHREFSSYEVELFSGLFYKPCKVNGTITLFRTGQINLTGVRTYQEMELLKNHILEELRVSG